MRRVAASDGSVKTEYRVGSSKEYYDSCDFSWVPAQVNFGANECFKRCLGEERRPGSDPRHGASQVASESLQQKPQHLRLASL